MKKRMLSIFLVCLSVFAIVACDKNEQKTKGLKGEGIAPYKLSERETNLLQSFNINQNNSQMFSFKTPKDMEGVYVQVYQLGKDGKWQAPVTSGIFTQDFKKDGKTLSGEVTVISRKNFAVEYTVKVLGSLITNTTDELKIDTSNMAFTTKFLQEQKPIKAYEEIPVALIIGKKDGAISASSMDDFHHPEKLKDMDFAQAITLKFVDNAYLENKKSN